MIRRTARTPARHRSLMLLVMLVFVWCQAVATAHASASAFATVAGTSTPMEAMPGCDGMPADADLGGTDCPAEDATSDGAKLPVFLPLPAQAYALVHVHRTAPAALARYAVPQGRAPPRPRLCCWLI